MKQQRSLSVRTEPYACSNLAELRLLQTRPLAHSSNDEGSETRRSLVNMDVYALLQQSNGTC